MQNLLNDLKSVLEKDDRLVSEGQLLKNKIVELALSMDVELIRLLLSHDDIRQHFFTDVDDVLVFDKTRFQQFVSNKAFLPDSYTVFKNKIGLTAEGQYLTDSKEVVLTWPYKDCILEGGQTKEDSKRDEVFWNETLAPDQIDRLLAPKVLTNFKKYNKDGEHKVLKISRDDNLAIKGNNLLALHTLKTAYAGQVKLIYIDPPYNTGNDSFKYNDNFNHSTWLTFIKNRLEVAKILLSENGAIWINIDENELGPLIVLCDEIFGAENFIALNAIRRSGATGHKAINPSPIATTDYLIGFAKNKFKWRYKITYTKRPYDKAYNKFIKEYDSGKENWKFCSIKDALAELNFQDPESLIEKYPERVVRFAEPNFEGVGKETKELILKSKKQPEKIMVQVRDEYKPIYLKNGDRILFYKDKLRKIDGKTVTAEPITNFWDDIPFQGIAKEGGVTLKKGKKPEALLRRIIEFSTEPNDLVLDFFSGSGTTAAVAQKMGRKFIAIEQLDYGDNDTLIRLKNVVNGDTSGISKFIEWRGGGSFIYCELAQANQTFADRIQDAKTTKELQTTWTEMQYKAFLSYKIDTKTIDLNSTDFTSLNLNDQKRFLIEVMDKNVLYISHSEMDDKSWGVSNEDKKLNRQFQGKTEGK